LHVVLLQVVLILRLLQLELLLEVSMQLFLWPCLF
jgi:hypothetical protein